MSVNVSKVRDALKNRTLELVVYYPRSMRGDKDFRKEMTRLFDLGVPMVEPKAATTPSGWMEYGNMVVRRPSGRSENQVRNLLQDTTHVALVVENRYEEFVLRTSEQEVELVEEITGETVRLNMSKMSGTIGVLKRIK